jgi:hypothetical protein
MSLFKNRKVVDGRHKAGHDRRVGFNAAWYELRITRFCSNFHPQEIVRSLRHSTGAASPQTPAR